MLQIFYPTEYVDSTYVIDFDSLRQKGKKGVIFDMDGTMFDTERLFTKGWIYAGKKLGVDIPVALTDSFRGRNPQAIRKKFAA